MLIAGLVAGLGWPAAGDALAPWLPQIIGVLLFLAALRIGPKGLAAGRANLVETLQGVGVLQCVLPLVLALIFWGLGLLHMPFVIALVLVVTGAPLAGSPNLTLMTGGDPGPALRLLVVGTALLPLTVLPVFALTGILEDADGLWRAALNLLLLIVCAAGLASLLHGRVMARPGAVDAVDGLSAVLMAVVVVGLMTASADALRNAPRAFALWLGYACLVNLGLQVLTALALRAPRFARIRVPFSIVAGNRNIALFLVALSPEAAAPLMLFIGCYQIPMYLTPYVMGLFHKRLG